MSADHFHTIVQWYEFVFYILGFFQCNSGSETVNPARQYSQSERNVYQQRARGAPTDRLGIPLNTSHNYFWNRAPHFQTGTGKLTDSYVVPETTPPSFENFSDRTHFSPDTTVKH